MLDRLRSVVSRWKQEPTPAAPADETTILSSYADSLLENERHDALMFFYLYGNPGIGIELFLRRIEGGPYHEDYDPTQQTQWTKHPQVCGRHFDGTWEPGLPGAKVGHGSRSPNSRMAPQTHYYIITYYVGDHRTFDSLGELHKQVLATEHEGEQGRGWNGGIVVALGCERSDEPGAVKSSDGRQFAKDRQLDFYETSSKTGYGCTETDFDKMMRSLLLPAANRYHERRLAEETKHRRWRLY